MTESIYIPRGVNTDALSQSAMWDYQPQGFKVRSLFSLFQSYIYQLKMSLQASVCTDLTQFKIVMYNIFAK